MKFKTKTKQGTPELSTSSLPDIIFLLLFFFMVSATIRPKEDIVQAEIPKAIAITKVDRKELVREITIGLPKNSAFGKEPRISVEGQFIEMDRIAQWLVEQRESLPEVLKDQMIVVLRADEHVEMGLVSDLEEELKKVNARKIVFRTLQE